MVMQLLSQLGAGQDQGGPGGPAGPPGADPYGGAPPDQPDQGGDQGGGDPLSATQQVIQDLHALIAVLPDHAMSGTAATCLAQLMKIQTQLMGAQQQASTAGAQLAQNIGGGPPSGGPGGY